MNITIKDNTISWTTRKGKTVTYPIISEDEEKFYYNARYYDTKKDKYITVQTFIYKEAIDGHKRKSTISTDNNPNDITNLFDFS